MGAILLLGMGGCLVPGVLVFECPHWFRYAEWPNWSLIWETGPLFPTRLLGLYEIVVWFWTNALSVQILIVGSDGCGPYARRYRSDHRRTRSITARSSSIGLAMGAAKRPITAIPSGFTLLGRHNHRACPPARKRSPSPRCARSPDTSLPLSEIERAPV
jgi:hypothetical protein